MAVKSVAVFKKDLPGRQAGRLPTRDAHAVHGKSKREAVNRRPSAAAIQLASAGCADCPPTKTNGQVESFTRTEQAVVVCTWLLATCCDGLPARRA